MTLGKESSGVERAGATPRAEVCLLHAPPGASQDNDWRGETMNALKLAVAVLVAASLAACAQHATSYEARLNQETATAAPPPPPEPVVSQFQQWLDSHQIPIAVPQEGKAIVVNIPGYELIAFEDGEPVLTSRVIVGSPRNPTPVMNTYTSVVRFRPTWRPTPDMVRSGEYGDYTRPPGPNNPLGLAALRLEEGLLIYLHSTNRPDLFNRDNRALSHGCVRVERWDELIAWALNIGIDDVHENANGGRTFDWPAHGIPVTLGYYTRFPDQTGTVRQYADIYGREPLIGTAQ